MPRRKRPTLTASEATQPLSKSVSVPILQRVLVFAFAMAWLAISPARAADAARAADGSVLPFPPVPTASTAGPTLQESIHVRRAEPNHLPADAPNILIVLLDDVGFGLPDTFGGEVHTPTLTRLANEGIAFNSFHTTSICSPTRAALLDRPQPPARRLGHDRRAGARLRRLYRRHPEERGDNRAGACTITATPPRPSASGTTRRRRKRLRWGRSTAGRQATASTISTAFSPARPRSTSRGCSRTPIRSSRRTTRPIT